jgi:hypothetical protein
MSFCLFANFSEPFPNTEAILETVAGLERAHVYTPDEAHDPFLNDGPAPPLILQLYFTTLPLLEDACEGPLELIRRHCDVEAMLVRRFAVPEPLRPSCTYLVAYEGTAEDENTWHTHYLAHHPPLMTQLPGIRELEIYTPIMWVSSAGWRRKRCMQRNKVAFDSAVALTAALHSPVRQQMRTHFLTLPPFSGRVTHYPMSTRVVSTRKGETS